jgi:hypothetical protein
MCQKLLQQSTGTFGVYCEMSSRYSERSQGYRWFVHPSQFDSDGMMLLKGGFGRQLEGILMNWRDVRGRSDGGLELELRTLMDDGCPSSIGGMVESKQSTMMPWDDFFETSVLSQPFPRMNETTEKSL